MRIAHSQRDSLRVLRSLLLSDVMNDIPSIAVARKRFETYRKEISTAPDYYGETVEEAEANVQSAIAKAIDAGKAIPANVFQPVAEAHARIVGASGINAAAQRIDDNLATELETTLNEHRDDVYAQLHDRLTDAVSNGRAALKDLGGVLTAEAAIDRDKPDAWTTYIAARREFVNIREAQRAMYRYADDVDYLDKFNPVAAALANPVETFNDIGAALWGVSQQTVNGNFKPVEAPWPDPWTDAGAHFDWLLNHPEATPWVPATAERAAVWQTLEAEARANSSAPRRLRDHISSPTHVAAIGQDGKVRTAFRTQPASA